MTDFYKSIVESCTKKFKITICKRRSDANSFKDNLDSPRKVVTSYPIHKVLFMKSIGVKCDDGKFPFFSIKSTQCMAEIYGGNAMIRMNISDDVALATPVL